MISGIASAGLFVAVPITGALALARGPIREGHAARIPLVVAAGVTLWSVPLLGSLIAQVYRPELIGLAGWAVVAAWLFVRRPQMPRLVVANLQVAVLAIGLAGAGLLYAIAPSEPMIGGRDMAVYANHAVYMVHHGRLDVPYPADLGTGDALPVGWVSFSGVYTTQPTLTVQFGHVFPAWLAQAYAVAGFGAVIRFNAIIAVLASLGIFAVARRWMPGGIAVLATLFLAFNAGQVWVTRNTLTEPLTQLFVWASLLLLLSSNQLRPRAAAAWAGVFLGMSAVVRLDSLVLLPLAVFGHSLVRIVADGRGDDRALHMPAFYAGAIPTFGLAVAYYTAFSRPYLAAHAGYLWPIGALAAAAVSSWMIAQAASTRAALARVLRMRRTLVIASIVLVFVALYAYLVRPLIGPYDLLNRPTPEPPRSLIELGMRYFGDYLTPVVLWGAILAWVATLTTAITRVRLRPLPVLVIIGGFSALYFWNQAITPDHFWVIRRYVPLILPAAVLFAGVAGSFVLARLPRAWRWPAYSLAVLVLALHTVRIGNPMFFVAERTGVHDALERFASALPADVTFLGPFERKTIHTSGTSLFLAFDVDMLPLAVDEVGGIDEVVSRLREASPTNPIPVLTTLADDPRVFVGETIAEVQHEFRRMDAPLKPVPQAVIDESFGLKAMWLTGVNTLELELVPGSHWLVAKEGFFPTEEVIGGMARWTGGDAEVRVPIFDGAHPGQLRIELESTGPLGTSLEIRVDGLTTFAGELPAGAWSGTVDLPAGRQIGDEVTIELISSTFVPAEVIEGSRDVRTLGVLVRSLQLLGPSP